MKEPPSEGKSAPQASTKRSISPSPGLGGWAGEMMGLQNSVGNQEMLRRTGLSGGSAASDPGDGSSSVVEQAKQALHEPVDDVPVELGASGLDEINAVGAADQHGVKTKSSNPGLGLMVEELVGHVQVSRGVDTSRELSHHTDRSEHEAKGIADTVVRGGSAPPVRERASALVQRQEAKAAPDPNTDARRLRKALKKGDHDIIATVLGQDSAHVKAVEAVFNSISATPLADEVSQRADGGWEWEHARVLLDRAGISTEGSAFVRASGDFQIKAEPEVQYPLPGMDQTLSVGRSQDAFTDPRSSAEYEWVCVNDRFAVAAYDAPDRVTGQGRGTWDVEWGYPGVHTVYARIKEKPYGEEARTPQWIERSFTVKSLDGRLIEAANESEPTDYVVYRAGLELQKMGMMGGVSSDQSDGVPVSIVVSGPNPAVPGIAPNFAKNTYRIQGVDPQNQHWYVLPQGSDPMFNADNLWGHPATDYQGRPAYDLGTGLSAAFTIGTPGIYDIVCELLDGANNPTGARAVYRQTILNGKEADQYRALDKEIGLIDAAMSTMGSEHRQTANAVYINEETGQQVQLMLYAGRKANGPGVIIVDATPGVRRKEYAGTDIHQALRTFKDQNSYPKGKIKYHIGDPSAPANQLVAIYGEIDTDGTSSWSEWASATGWASLGFFALGAVATFVPGGQVAAPFLFAAGVGAGVGSGAMSIYDELQNAEPSSSRIAIDVLSIAGTILGGGAAIKAVKHGAGVVLTGMSGRFFVYGALSADIGSAVLLTADGIDRISNILDDSALDEAAKIRAVVSTLANLALVGGLVALGVREVGAVKRRLGAILGKKSMKQLPDRTLLTLSRLDDEVLSAIGGKPTRLQRVADLMEAGARFDINGGQIRLANGQQLSFRSLENMSDDEIRALGKRAGSTPATPSAAPKTVVGTDASAPPQGALVQRLALADLPEGMQPGDVAIRLRPNGRVDGVLVGPNVTDDALIRGHVRAAQKFDSWMLRFKMWVYELYDRVKNRPGSADDRRLARLEILKQEIVIEEFLQEVAQRVRTRDEVDDVIKRLEKQQAEWEEVLLGTRQLNGVSHSLVFSRGPIPDPQARVLTTAYNAVLGLERYIGDQLGPGLDPDLVRDATAAVEQAARRRDGVLRLYTSRYRAFEQSKVKTEPKDLADELWAEYQRLKTLFGDDRWPNVMGPTVEEARRIGSNAVRTENQRLGIAVRGALAGETADGLAVGFTGSLSKPSPQRGPPKANVPASPATSDVDLYVVASSLFSRLAARLPPPSHGGTRNFVSVDEAVKYIDLLDPADQARIRNLASEQTRLKVKLRAAGQSIHPDATLAKSFLAIRGRAP